MDRRNRYRLPASMFSDMTDIETAFALLEYDRSIWPVDGCDGAIALIDAAEEAVECAEAWGGIDAACAGLRAPMAIAAVL